MLRTLKNLGSAIAVALLFILLAVSQPLPLQEAAAAQTIPQERQNPEIRLLLFGKMIRIQLSVGVLGITVIITLAVLLGLAILFAWMARRRLKQARTANQKLEVEILERKRAEEQVNRLNTTLENRVAERTREVEEANQQLAAANKELEAFAYSVSHDLRAPLRGIDGWSLALIEDYGNRLDTSARQYLDRVRSETQRMGGLIDDLLQLSKVTRAEMTRTSVDLTRMAQEVAARLLEAHPERRIEFEIAPALTTHGDAGLLYIVLTNLLSNAVKFTARRRDAKIEFGQTRSNEESVFFVRDNGAGFDMAFADMLFGAFQRLHKTTEFPGSGIGLATVQRIIHRHGGRVWAEAQPDQGATFYFTVRSANEA